VIHNNCIHLWHWRLGHRDPNAIQRTYKESLATGICINECNLIMICENCINAAKQPIDLIHSDVCGPIKTQTPGKTFIDDYSRSLCAT